MSALPFALRLTCCCCCWLTCFVIIVRPVFTITSPDHDRKTVKGIEQLDDITYQLNKIRDDNRYQRNGRDGDNPSTSKLTGDNDGIYEDTDVDLSYDGEEDEDYSDSNITEKGRYLGSPCEDTCHPDLQHVLCDSAKGLCVCEPLYPVRLGPTKGCAKPKKLGEQCFYQATCTWVDQHSICAQVQHNAVCDCEAGYHRVALSRPSKKIFCAEDLVLITTDVPTLLGVASGLAVFTGLICFVLKLFSRARYTRPRHYANANHAPPMLFSSDTGIPLTLHGGRPSSRSSQRSESDGPNSCSGYDRRTSSGGSRGPLVPASRAGAARAAAILLISCHLQAATTKGGNKHRRTLSDVAEGSSDGLGSRRPSLASVHSSTSSARSYSARRLERERNDKEQRQALQELRLARSREQQEIAQQIVAPTPSPRTPHSTDELLPSVEEGKEVFYNEQISATSLATETPGTSTSSSALSKRTSAANEASTMPKRTSSANETSTIPKKSSIASMETSLVAPRRTSNSNEMSSVGSRRTTTSNEHSSITKKSSMLNETAFTAPSACTSAFTQELSSNCSSSVDIFES